MLALFRSFRYALDGLSHALRTQRNMRIHFLAAFLVIVLSGLIQVSIAEIVAVLFSISLVIVLELVNTAIEHIVDILMKEFHPAAKVAKDVAAAAVFIAAANALAVAYLIFFNKLHPALWRPVGTLLRPPFLGVLLVGLLCLIVTICAYAFRQRPGKTGGGSSGGQTH